jgi:hypothetical protein
MDITGFVISTEGRNPEMQQHIKLGFLVPLLEQDSK